MPFVFTDRFVKELILWSNEASDGRKDHHITRVAMYRALRDRFLEFDELGKRALSISKSKRLATILGLSKTEIVEANYPAHSFVDLSSFEDSSFDFCVSDQVLEHVEGSPFQAFSESVRVLKPGGAICHTTCFINPVHAHPNDFWRFTTEALRMLASQAGCVNIVAEGWGNKDAWALVQLGLRRLPLTEEVDHPLLALATRNDKRWPMVVWVTATKPIP